MIKVPPKLVCVHWTDAFDSSNGWITLKEYTPKVQYVISVGFLLEGMLSGHVSLTGSWMPTDEEEMSESGMITHIPMGMVNKIVELTSPDFSYLDLTVYGEKNPTQQPDPTLLSPALDYPPYGETTQRATNHQQGNRE